MCFALNHFAGRHFNRVTVYCGDASKLSAWDAVNRVRDSLVANVARYIRMNFIPDPEADPTIKNIRANF
jgi:hypothetical protein